MNHFYIVSVDSAGIISPPVSVNVTIGTTASFQCTVEGGPLYWTVNGSDSPGEWGGGVNFDTRPAGTGQMSTLSIMATLSRNITLVKCAVNDIESDTALLLIQGMCVCVHMRICIRQLHHDVRVMSITFSSNENCNLLGLLGAPSGLSVNSNYTVIDLIWNEPYSLDITNMEPDISHFRITVENTRTGSYFLANTSRAKFMLYQQSSVDVCTIYRFQVAAVNSVGFGESSEAVNSSFNTCRL